MFPRCFVARRLVVLAAVCCPALFADTAGAATVYTFDGLTNGSLTGQDTWTTYLTYTGFNVLDATDVGINTSKVALSTAGSPAFSIRPNDASFAFPLLSATATGATLQFDIKASLSTTASTYFGLAGNVDTTPGINTTSERSPAFGIINGVFGIQHLGASAGLTDLGTPASKGVDEGDWLQMQMVIDFTANSGNGAATVWYKNLTQSDTDFTRLTANPVNLGLTTRYTGVYAAMRNPANWNSLIIARGNPTAMQVDNLIGNLPVEISPVYTFERLANGSLTGQDGWTKYGENNAFSIIDGTGVNTSKVAFAITDRNNFSVRPNDSNWSFNPHDGSMAAMQFDLRFMPGTNDPSLDNSGVYFGLAADVDSTAGITNTSERGPAFGILMSQFGIQHLGNSVNWAALGRPDDDFGVAEGDWLRLQMVVDLTESANGDATLYFMNLSQGDLGWTQINSTPVNLGLTGRYTGVYAALRDPANWDTMMIVRAATVGLEIDNLMPNAVVIPEPSSLLLAVLGLLGFMLSGRRR